jgi:hypothetical protein
MIFLEMLWSIIIHALFKIPYFISFRTNFIYYYHSFKTWSGPRGSTRDWNGAWLKKKHGKKKPGVTQLTRRVDSTTRSKTRLQPIDFCFFFLLKQCRFDFFKKKLIQVTRLKPRIQILDRTGFKNYNYHYLKIQEKWQDKENLPEETRQFSRPIFVITTKSICSWRLWICYLLRRNY